MRQFNKKPFKKTKGTKSGEHAGHYIPQKYVVLSLSEHRHTLHFCKSEFVIVNFLAFHRLKL